MLEEEEFKEIQREEAKQQARLESDIQTEQLIKQLMEMEEEQRKLEDMETARGIEYEEMMEE